MLTFQGRGKTCHDTMTTCSVSLQRLDLPLGLAPDHGTQAKAPPAIDILQEESSACKNLESESDQESLADSDVVPPSVLGEASPPKRNFVWRNKSRKQAPKRKRVHQY